MSGTITASLVKFKCTNFVGGSSQYVSFGNQTTYNFERTDPFSLSCWIKKSDANFASYINKLTNSAPFRGYDMYHDTLGRIGLTLQNDGSPGTNQIGAITIRTGINDGKWHHIVGTYDGSVTSTGMQIYIDGGLETVQRSSNSLTGTSQNTVVFAVGARPTNSPILPLTGSMMDVAVYNKSLSQGEVTAIHNSHCPPDLTAVGPTGNLVGYWLLGTHVGDTSLAAKKTTYPTCPDAGSGAHAGTMSNMSAGSIVTRV